MRPPEFRTRRLPHSPGRSPCNGRSERNRPDIAAPHARGRRADAESDRREHVFEDERNSRLFVVRAGDSAIEAISRSAALQVGVGFVNERSGGVRRWGELSAGSGTQAMNLSFCPHTSASNTVPKAPSGRFPEGRSLRRTSRRTMRRLCPYSCKPTSGTTRESRRFRFACRGSRHAVLRRIRRSSIRRDERPVAARQFRRGRSLPARGRRPCAWRLLHRAEAVPAVADRHREADRAVARRRGGFRRLSYRTRRKLRRKQYGDAESCSCRHFSYRSFQQSFLPVGTCPGPAALPAGSLSATEGVNPPGQYGHPHGADASNRSAAVTVRESGRSESSHRRSP